MYVNLKYMYNTTIIIAHATKIMKAARIMLISILTIRLLRMNVDFKLINC